ncbi:MAG: hypothetical protein L3J33_02590 [Rhodobacteraceae bacterium]|nr:hypothetical protein [Paracoccaceae bacterium]
MALSKIAIIGWGSLIWDLEVLTPHTRGGWQMTKGPRLPMEFSRISPKRKMGLVVCLDPLVGVECATHVIRSVRGDVQMALKDLAARERAPHGRIGWADIARGASRMNSVVLQVQQWCAENGWDGAVWTDLEPNFRDHTGQDFSVDQGIAYLKALDGRNLSEAFEYIENAPRHTKTPLRDALRADDWWQSLKKNKQR